jgi:hypothetical protein
MPAQTVEGAQLVSTGEASILHNAIRSIGYARFGWKSFLRNHYRNLIIECLTLVTLMSE